MKKMINMRGILLTLVVAMVVPFCFQACQLSQKDKDVLKEEALGIPRLVSFGSDLCLPCKMMEPVREELIRDYEGKLLVEYVNVTFDRERTSRYGVIVIPVLVYFDKEGWEFHRSTGFSSKEEILKVFSDRGMPLD